MNIRFVFVGEGPSDEYLIPMLEELCSELGGSRAQGTAAPLRALPEPPGKQIHAQALTALALVPDANLLFVHRDTDNEPYELRRQQITEGITRADIDTPFVPVIPVRETEAWALLDEAMIREVAENPRGTQRLNLPSPQHVHSVVNPKERLESILELACGHSGRKLKKFKKRFPSQRRRLLEELDIHGPLRHVPAWQQLRQDVEDAIAQLQDSAIASS